MSENPVVPGAGRIGLIAGSGDYPLLIARRAREQGLLVHAAVLADTDTDRYRDTSATVKHISPAKLGSIKKYFIGHQVTRLFLAGKVEKKMMYRVIPDADALRLLNAARDRRDDSLLNAVCDYFKNAGITVEDSTLLVRDQIVQPGRIAGPVPDEALWQDISFGYRMGKSIAGLDLGQTVVVRDRAVTAAEAIEGTDEAIKRGALLANGGATVVKVSKPRQDIRFDLPVIGRQTVAVAIEHRVRCLAIESGQSLFFQQAETVALAKQHKLTLIGLPYQWDGSDRSFI